MATTPQSPSSVLGAYNATLPTWTDGQTTELQTDANGRVLVVNGGRLTSTATIANGASLSGAVDMGATYRPSRITMPAAWTAASLSFQVSADGVTYNEMLDKFLAPVGYANADVSQDFALDPDTWTGVRYLKIRSGPSDTPVTQGGSRAIVVTGVPY